MFGVCNRTISPEEDPLNCRHFPLTGTTLGETAKNEVEKWPDEGVRIREISKMAPAMTERSRLLFLADGEMDSYTIETLESEFEDCTLDDDTTLERGNSDNSSYMPLSYSQTKLIREVREPLYFFKSDSDLSSLAQEHMAIFDAVEDFGTAVEGSALELGRHFSLFAKM
jgi:hypothetical protein